MSWNAVETFGRIVRCLSLISINVAIYVAHAVETFGRIVRCFNLISINVVVYGVKQPMTTIPVLGGSLSSVHAVETFGRIMDYGRCFLCFHK